MCSALPLLLLKYSWLCASILLQVLLPDTSGLGVVMHCNILWKSQLGREIGLQPSWTALCLIVWRGSLFDCRCVTNQHIAPFLVCSPTVTIKGVANTVTVTTANVKAGNSIIHLIDGVLLPSAPKKVEAAAGPTPSPSTPAPAAPAPAPTSGAVGLVSGAAAAAAAAMGCLMLAL